MTGSPENCPWPIEFVRASRLREQGASDADVRQAIEAVENRER